MLFLNIAVVVENIADENKEKSQAKKYIRAFLISKKF